MLFRSGRQAVAPAGADMGLINLSGEPEDLPQQREQALRVRHGDVGLPGDRAAADRAGYRPTPPVQHVR